MQDAVNTSPTVLVVDDDEALRAHARTALECAGFRVSEAGTGREAVETAADKNPDVLILDMDLPDTDGAATCLAIRRVPALVDMPIIMLTHPADYESVHRAYEAGATDFISKPIDWPLMCYRVRYGLRAGVVSRGLRYSEIRNRTFIKAMPDSMLVVDRNGIPLQHHLGKDGSPLIKRWSSNGGSILDILPPATADSWRNQITDVLETRHTISSQTRFTVDGRTHYFETRMAHYTQSSVLIILRDVSEQKRADAKVHRLAFFDTLTGLPNRQSFLIQVSQAINQANSNDGAVAILYIDLDNFKRINDSLGHSIGDELLKHIAARLAGCLRKQDFVARFGKSNSNVRVARLGGDEFMILLPDIGSCEDATAIAERINEVLSEPLEYNEQQFVITPSIGIAMYPDDGEDSDTLLKNADMAMYDAKSAGRNCVSSFSGTMSLRSLERLDLEDSLRQAIANGDLELRYQPKLDLRSQQAYGVEALVRWTHPERGPISPAKFIPIAEEAGMILPLSDWVLQTACDQLRDWKDGPLDEVTVAINLSAKQFFHADIDGQIMRALSARGLDNKRLELELTEGTLMRNVDNTIKAMSRLRDAGLRIAVDDFGTGYSSLSYLKRFPIDALKIDRSFVAEVGSAGAGDDRSICKAIIALANGLNLRVIAEGVETAEQLQYLRSLGCDAIQGYFFARPMDAAGVTAFLCDHREQGVAMRLRAEFSQ